MKYALSNCLTAALVYVLSSGSTVVPVLPTLATTVKPRTNDSVSVASIYPLTPAVPLDPIIRSKYYVSFIGRTTTTIITDTLNNMVGNDTSAASSVSDTTTFDINYDKYFNDVSDLLSFCRYIKTQSYNDGEATWITIAVMFNRMTYHKCDWNTYYNTPRINNSRTIRLLKSGKFKKSFRLTDKLDSVLCEQVKQSLRGLNPVDVPKNVLYFEACNKSPNRNVHSMKNLWRKVISDNKRVKPTRFYSEPSY